MAEIAAEIHSELAAHKATLEADTARVNNGFNAARSIAKSVGTKGEKVKSLEDLAAIIDQHRPGM